MKKLALAFLFLLAAATSAEAVCPYNAPLTWYWVVGDTNPNTQVFSTDPANTPGSFVSNSSTPYTNWTGLGCTATQIATAAAVYGVIDGYNKTLPAQKCVNTINSAVNVVLTNPICLTQNITFTASGKNLQMPPMNVPGSPPVGTPMFFYNQAGQGFALNESNGSLIVNVAPGDTIVFYSQSNSTPQGAFGVADIMSMPSPYNPGQIIIDNGVNWVGHVISGDCTMTAAGVMTCTTASGARPNSITNAMLSTVPGNSIKGNWTGSTGNVGDNTMPSCPDTAPNHLNYLSGTGIVCGTSMPTPAQIGAVTHIKNTVFTASGTYTPSTGMLWVEASCIGGGGGGGGATGATSAYYTGQGGGAGSKSIATVAAATIGASKTVTIGPAGSGASGAAGGNGGDSCITSNSCTVGQIVTGKGGTGGDYSSGSHVPANTNNGGVAGSGDITGTGQNGGAGSWVSNASTLLPGGTGGSSERGGGGVGQINSTAGNSATGYGAGGGGAAEATNAASLAGGNGSPGICWVTEYINQ